MHRSARYALRFMAILALAAGLSTLIAPATRGTTPYASSLSMCRITRCITSKMKTHCSFPGGSVCDTVACG
ncbi:MAG: hypothetical protein DMF50_07245 [Acidobacteria bacterium]|nr:MAG: hypothetical protein DMF50_07245 [Acidobacteriota bacterium]